MESLAYHGYRGIDNGTKVHHFGLKPEKCCKDVDATVYYIGRMVMKKGYDMKSINIAKIES